MQITGSSHTPDLSALSAQHQLFISDNEMIGAIMKELSKVDLVPIIPQIEKNYRCRNWWIDKLMTDLELPENTEHCTIGDVASIIKQRFPQYNKITADSVTSLDMNSICSCLCLLAVDYGYYLYKNQMI